MQNPLIVFALLVSGIVFGQERQVIAEKGKDRFETQFAPGGRIQLDVRSGEVQISGSDSDKISIHYEGRNGNETSDMDVYCSGGPRNGFQIWIEIPKETGLHVRMPFGELDIENVHGSKDVEIHAGQLTMEIGDPSDYARIDASVLTGELNLPTLGISKGGLFRSYKKDGHGRYKLYAHVGSGEIDLQ